MSSTPISKFTAGQKFTPKASDLNAFADAAKFTRGQIASRGSGPVDLGTSTQTRVLVRNDSGVIVPRFGVLGIDGVAIEPNSAANRRNFTNGLVFTGATPVVATHSGKFVVAEEPIIAGKIGRAIVAGICIALVEVTDEAHTTADVKASTAELKSGGGSAEILWKESGTGTAKLAIIRISTGFGVTSSPTTIGSSGEAPDDASGTDYEDQTITRLNEAAVEAYFSLGTGYHHDGDQVLLEYKLRVLFDSRLNVVELGPISKHTIDAPEECPDTSQAQLLARMAVLGKA